MQKCLRYDTKWKRGFQSVSTQVMELENDHFATTTFVSGNWGLQKADKGQEAYTVWNELPTHFSLTVKGKTSNFALESPVDTT